MKKKMFSNVSDYWLKVGQLGSDRNLVQPVIPAIISSKLKIFDCNQVQNGLGKAAHILESIENVFNFSVPFLSWLGLFIFCVATVLLYNVPLR